MMAHYVCSLVQRILEQGLSVNGRNIGSTGTGGVVDERDSLLLEVVPPIEPTTEAVPARPLITYLETSPTNAQILPESEETPADPTGTVTVTAVIPDATSEQPTEVKPQSYSSTGFAPARREVDEVRTSSGKRRMLMTFSDDDEVSVQERLHFTTATCI
jgi:hypothetical protein